jgi:hypothetical protein
LDIENNTPDKGKEGKLTGPTTAYQGVQCGRGLKPTFVVALFYRLAWVVMHTRKKKNPLRQLTFLYGSHNCGSAN